MEGTTRKKARISQKEKRGVSKSDNATQSDENTLDSNIYLIYDILRIVFQHLNVRDLSSAAMVCRSWLEAANNKKWTRSPYCFVQLFNPFDNRIEFLSHIRNIRIKPSDTLIIFRRMLCNARGRCDFCCNKHTVSVFGSDEAVYTFLQKLNLRLVGTIAKKPHIERPTGFTYRSTDNLEIMEKLRVNDKFQTGKATEIDAKAEKSVDSIGTENKTGINNSRVRENTESIRKKQLTCEFCQKEFNHAGDLNKHRRKHTGEQPYACNMCEWKFTTSSNLVRHQQIHLGIKPFCCQICGRTFTRKIKLSAHLTANHHEVLKSNGSMV